MNTHFVGLLTKPSLLLAGLLSFPLASLGDELLTFDDLTDGAVVTNGYGGLQWSNFTVMGKQDPWASDGYQTGLVSLPNVIYNPYGDDATISSASLFDLKSAYLTAAVLAPLPIEVQGFVGTNLIYDQTNVLTTSGPNFITFNYLGVNQVNFIPIPNSQFVLDNLTVAFNSTNASAPVQGTVNLGNIQVPTIGHQFSRSLPGLPPGFPGSQSQVTDFLVNQRQIPAGGGISPTVTANFDTNNQFVITITAPPGEKFQVRVPAGQAVRFGGQLDWQGPCILSNGPSFFGTTAVSFGGLEGVPPGYFAESAALSQLHGFFGFNDIQSLSFSNNIAFTSITLTATVPDTNAGSGTWGYIPTSDNSLAFYYPTSQTNDPGTFVSLVPAPLTPGEELLTFDNLVDGAVVSNGYGGLQWNNFAVISEQDPFAGYGYRTGMVSPSNVVYNPYGVDASISGTGSFDLVSAYLTAAVLSPLPIEVQGFVGTNLAYDQTYVLTTNGPNLVTFNYLGVNQVNFIPIPNSQFVMDNLTVTLHGATNAPPPPPVPGLVNLGVLPIPSVGHVFARGLPGLPPTFPGAQNVVRDYLVDQRQVSSGGTINSPVSANFDTNNQFVLTLTAPPGQRFLVHVPAGQSVRFGGQLDWQGPNVLANGPGEFGTTAVSFGDLEGAAPAYFAQSADLSQLHGFFGFNDIQSLSFSNDISFTSITLLATVPDANVGSGTLAYTPTSDNALVFYYTTSQTNDPGPFTSLVSETQPVALALGVVAPTPTVGNITLEPNGNLTIAFTGTLQSASDPNGPFVDVPGSPSRTYTLPKASLGTQQYFRTRQ